MKSNMLQQLMDHIGRGQAHYFNSMDGVYIKAPIQRVKNDNSYIMIWFDNGLLEIFNTDTITKVRRPTNRLNKCEWCFRIISSEGKTKGWILKDLEEGEQ